MTDRPQVSPGPTGAPPDWLVEPPASPVDLFNSWLDEAVEAGVVEPRNMVLASRDKAGAPDARVMVLKDLIPAGEWCFAGSSDSPKGRQLARDARAALVFSWPDRGQSVRVSGRARERSPAAAAADFARRGEGARAVALVGGQSRPIADADRYDSALAQTRQRVDHDPALVPSTWRLWAVVAHRVEFWQSGQDGRHHRLLFTRDGDAWHPVRLRP